MGAFRDLESLLLALFSSEELRRFISYQPGGDTLLGELPGAGEPPVAFVHELVALLKRRGILVKPGFWAELRDARKHRVREIDAIRLCIAKAEDALETTGDSAGPVKIDVANARPTDRHSIRKVLFVSASPPDLSRLRVDQEFRELRSRLDRTGPVDRLELIHMPASRLEDLRSGLLEHEPNVLHISCHGKPGGILCFDSGGYGDAPSSVKPENMLRLLRAVGESLELVILNACHSASLAREISGIVGPCISMEGSIVDDEAIRFSLAFYEVLSYRKAVTKAFEAALAGLGEGVPRLFIDAVLWEGSPEA